MIEQDDRRCLTALVEVSTWFFGRLMALAAGPPTIFQDREDVRPEGLRATGSTNAMTQVFMAGPQRVGRGDRLLTGGPLRITAGQKRGRKMHGTARARGDGLRAGAIACAATTADADRHERRGEWRSALISRAGS